MALFVYALTRLMRTLSVARSSLMRAASINRSPGEAKMLNPASSSASSQASHCRDRAAGSAARPSPGGIRGLAARALSERRMPTLLLSAAVSRRPGVCRRAYCRCSRTEPVLTEAAPGDVRVASSMARIVRHMARSWKSRMTPLWVLSNLSHQRCQSSCVVTQSH